MISGKGRCNITNTADIADFVEAFHPNGKFLYSAFSQFFREEITGILHSRGVKTKIERGGRIFPSSDKATDVADALTNWAISCGVDIRTATNVKQVSVVDKRVVGVEVFGGNMPCKTAIIATGGMSYPLTGSTGDGYEMAQSLGHTTIPPRAALSQLKMREKWCAKLEGLSLKNVEAKLYPADSQKHVACEFGEMVFTSSGVSGPIILTLSRKAQDIMKKSETVIELDLKPALSHEQLHEKLQRELIGKKQLGTYFRSILPRLMAEEFASLTQMAPDKNVSNITTEERQKIINTLKGLRMHVQSLGPIEEAIVTAGGIKTSEIDPSTMQSKLIDGLYFAGEVIDVDGETGGYNLQASFSTGYVAGTSAALMISRD